MALRVHRIRTTIHNQIAIEDKQKAVINPDSEQSYLLAPKSSLVPVVLHNRGLKFGVQRPMNRVETELYQPQQYDV